jgi:Phage portal protein, SPP1 Gp6-like
VPEPETLVVMAKALDDFRDRVDRYALYRAYYHGAHRVAFQSSKWNQAFGVLYEGLVDNLMACVVDAASDRLQITGFGVEEGPETAGDDAWTVWEANRMDRRSGEVHTECLRQGDAYVVVWPSQDGKATVYPQRAETCTVGYDPETPGLILWGAKGWITDADHFRLTLYFGDRIEKWITLDKVKGHIPEDPEKFIPYELDPEAPDGILVNPFDQVPMFHFANNAAIGNFGNSELRDPIPLNDLLNKTLKDLATSSEFISLPQRWATGLQLDEDPLTGKPKIPFTPGVERIWTVGDKDVKFGQFDAADLRGHLETLEMCRMEIARVSSTPAHFFMLQSGNWPSGEALRTSESRFLSKIHDRMAAYGNNWEDVFSFAILVEGGPKGIKLTTDWEDPAPRSELEHAQELEIKKRLGVPTSQIWRELGYTEEEISIMEVDKQREAEANAALVGQSMLEFNAGR